jgi:hypothetical protein
MILIAQPKSASTSLLETLRAIGKLKGNKYKDSETERYEYEGLTLPHSNFQDCSDKELLTGACTSKDKLYQIHLPPTRNNRKIIKKVGDKVLILLRDPTGSVEGYTRHIYSGRKHNYAKTKQKAKEHHKVLTWFNREWRSFAKKNPELALVINFEDLILNNKKYIDQATAFLEMPVIKKITKLKKARYTGQGMKKVLRKKKLRYKAKHRR